MSWVDRKGYQGPPPTLSRSTPARPPGASRMAPLDREPMCIVGDFTPEGYDPECPFKRMPASTPAPPRTVIVGDPPGGVRRGIKLPDDDLDAVL